MNQNTGQGFDGDAEESIDCGGICPPCGSKTSFGIIWYHLNIF